MITRGKLNTDGTTSLSVWWNIRRTGSVEWNSQKGYREVKVTHNQISVEANPESGELVVRGGGDEEKRLESHAWQSDAQLLKDAIESVYENPMIVTDTAATLS